MEEKMWWWIAINGTSVAASPMPLPETLCVTPRPHTLIGFPTHEEAIEQQQFFLNAPIEDTPKRTEELYARARKGQLVVIQPPNPEPQTEGQTVWMSEDIPGLIAEDDARRASRN